MIIRVLDGGTGYGKIGIKANTPDQNAAINNLKQTAKDRGFNLIEQPINSRYDIMLKPSEAIDQLDLNEDEIDEDE